MMKDPLTKWDGLFPYDALAPVGITPDSGMKEIRDASFDLMTRGLMTPEVRAAWDELRIIQKRLLVDFFMYQFDFQEELKKVMEKLDKQLIDLGKVPDVSDMLKIDLEDLRQIHQDLREIPMQDVEIQFLPEFKEEPKLPNLDFIEFDK